MIKKKSLISSNGGLETHAIITASDPMLPFSAQLAEVMEGYSTLISGFSGKMKPVFCRWFLSDAANQAALLPELKGCAVSVVEQPPLSMTKVALWVWAMEIDSVTILADGSVTASDNGGYTHIFEGSRNRPGIDSEKATYEMLRATEDILHDFDASLLDNCVRTWFFVQNVDVNYAGVVEGRNRAFSELGLTPSTRFIASTGIGGRHSDRKVTVQMDSYSVKGLEKGQMRQINAPEYLNPTYEYGVAFERATAVDYGDRRHLFISGTASIDNRGEVVWEGDIRRQTLRMWTNVEALLKAADCDWADVGQILVYLRDPADYPVVAEMFEERFPDTPHIILLAPVCRPGWLIEMECMAMKPISTDFLPF
ncbi:MAG: hypothetical protein HDR88_02025 [Bacteroides sp.]|nr:hypothetical protein [Bacteroides sp.]